MTEAVVSLPPVIFFPGLAVVAASSALAFLVLIVAVVIRIWK
jgi:hypothetical protein